MNIVVKRHYSWLSVHTQKANLCISSHSGDIFFPHGHVIFSGKLLVSSDRTSVSTLTHSSPPSFGVPQMLCSTQCIHIVYNISIINNFVLIVLSRHSSTMRMNEHNPLQNLWLNKTCNKTVTENFQTNFWIWSFFFARYTNNLKYSVKKLSAQLSVIKLQLELQRWVGNDLNDWYRINLWTYQLDRNWP